MATRISRKSMVVKLLLLFLSVLTYELHAQHNVGGLSKYKIGITTPDSLDRTIFKEEEQAYVKGTIALPCTHIRTFKAAKIPIWGISVTDLSLYFYDNLLFKLACNSNDSLDASFVLEHGEGISKSKDSRLLCARSVDKPMLMEQRTWHTGNVFAVIIHAKGYNTACELDEVTRLIITSRAVVALASDCELPERYPFVEGLDSLQNGRY